MDLVEIGGEGGVDSIGSEYMKRLRAE
jgi:hypothetical protein